MEKSLVKGSKVNESNIVKMGLTGDVYISDFIKSLREFSKILKDNDIVVFIFQVMVLILMENIIWC